MGNTHKIIIFLLVTFLFESSINGQIQQSLKVASESEIDVKTYSGIISERYANGSPSLWKTVINGKSNGLWLEWYPNGNVRYRAYWKNSKGHGKWEYFYPNGQLQSESFYINDIAQGLFKAYHKNGQLKTDAVFLNGKKHGIELTYDVTGLLISRKRFENGEQLIDEPTIFQEGIISESNGNEWGITFTPDGYTAYFTRRDLDNGTKRIYTTSKTKNGWQKPTIASFSTDEDEAAFINNDGSKFYFASYRPLPNGNTTTKMDMNIWVMDKTNNSWSEPKPLSNVINKSMKENNAWPANYEAGPATDANGNLYYWTKGTRSEGTNLYFSELKKNGDYTKPLELLPPSSHTNYDTAPQLSPDGNILVFSSDNRNDGYGGSDIYYSLKTDSGWSTPINLGPVINSSQSDGFPSFSPEGKYFFFSSNRGDTKDDNGERIWNIYYIETKYLMIKNN
ncbi:hypothetical protein ACFQ1Q_02405 [Winogradskyella litorisediminis]|uniref:WD40 repeat protein n=1 Tax=Winogradskyella litorisediminis TaxID=1156618 RepID=A0ABW3N629_9FLAO